MTQLRSGVDEMLSGAHAVDKEQVQVLETYRMFANSSSWMRRMEADVGNGLSRRGRRRKGAISGPCAHVASARSLSARTAA